MFRLRTPSTSLRMTAHKGDNAMPTVLTKYVKPKGQWRGFPPHAVILSEAEVLCVDKEGLRVVEKLAY